MKSIELNSGLATDGEELFRKGEVSFEVTDGEITKIRTEVVELPEQAAYFTLLNHGLSERDILTKRLKLKTILAKSIQHRVPNWEDLMEHRKNLPMKRDRIVDQQG